jgi:hypothetical protein
MKHKHVSRNYKCRGCGGFNNSNNGDSEYCTMCQAERLAALQEAEWDRRREDELIRRDAGK